jgi:hypothetical protein
MDGDESTRTHAHNTARTDTHGGANRADRRLGGRMVRRCGWAHAREQARGAARRRDKRGSRDA